MISRCKNIFIINCERKLQHSLINSPEIISLLLLKRGWELTHSQRCLNHLTQPDQTAASVTECSMNNTWFWWTSVRFSGLIPRNLTGERKPLDGWFTHLVLQVWAQLARVLVSSPRPGPGALPVWDDLQPSCQSWPLRYNNMRKTWTSTWHHHVAGNGLIL